ncbi:hypothetical protein SAMN03159343_2079 [Klenkia marina]|uniref:Uncharacterized protein n=1 Tax=Klenkia marina TaxID=1960309 RepID=A0A1G4Y6E1_9ACTN|nr:hypothetical protein [Klenkia marina]SCX48982.1 hypothetical protein SAMN03159343_2079 [Klenkia marina]
MTTTTAPTGELATIAAHRAHAHAVALALRDAGLPRATFDATTGTIEPDPANATMTTSWAIRPRSVRRLDLADAADDAGAVAERLGRVYPVVVQKRRMADDAQHYVVMSLSTFAALLRDGLPGAMR